LGKLESVIEYKHVRGGFDCESEAGVGNNTFEDTQICVLPGMQEPIDADGGWSHLSFLEGRIDLIPWPLKQSDYA
jgi:hypothetical protein